MSLSSNDNRSDLNKFLTYQIQKVAIFPLFGWPDTMLDPTLPVQNNIYEFLYVGQIISRKMQIMVAKKVT